MNSPLQNAAPLDNLLQQFFSWRLKLSQELHFLHSWLREQKLANAGVNEKIARMLHKLEQEKITVAVVAEFSRGKTELINALFFADHGKRLLPSGAGTTTMCPTEILYDASIPPGLHLLPIETRASNEGLQQYKKNWNGWVAVPFDLERPETISGACKPLAETIMAPVETAELYGLYDGKADDSTPVIDGKVEIPRWRHAVFNFPHPLLKQGLVIIDTPGLNAIGTEPELTLSTIPNAHAVLFVLGADTGVTKSDRAIWLECITTAGIPRQNCVVALNKIDTMWDDMRPAAEYDADIEQQIKKTAQILGLPEDRVFPVSAQKALIARVQNNPPLLARSRLLPLEKALAEELPQSHLDSMRHALKADVTELLQRVAFDLSARQDNNMQRQKELALLQGKSREFLNAYAHQAAGTREAFDSVSGRLDKLQVIVTRHGHGLLNTLDPKLWQMQVNGARGKMLSSFFSKGVVDAMREFMANTKANLAAARSQSEEIHGLAEAIYMRFIDEHGFKQTAPSRMPFERYFTELAWLEKKLDERFGNLLRMITSAKSSYTKKYFDALAGNVIQLYETAHRDSNLWIKDLMQPLQGEVAGRRTWLAQRETDLAAAAQTGQTAGEQFLNLGAEMHSLHGLKTRLAEFDQRLKIVLPEQNLWWAQGVAA
jgi:Dynamin family